MNQEKESGLLAMVKKLTLFIDIVKMAGFQTKSGMTGKVHRDMKFDTL